MNISLLFNKSESEIIALGDSVDQTLIRRYVENRAIDEPAYTILIIFYCILILVGASGNTLVIMSVVRKPSMRTPRNMFIVNLAVSDFLLCTITMPLTLMEILTKYWPLGEHLIVCKVIGTLQATSIFVSTISITAIALDRYQVIVYPTRESLQKLGAAIILVFIWTIAIILACPLFIFKTLIHCVLRTNATGLDSVNFCIEDWPLDHGRAYYSIFSLIVQYILPIFIVSAAYLRIYFKLRYRFAGGFNDDNSVARRQLRGRRLQRTNLLLASIAVIFCISWLPLNVFNLIADISISVDFTSQNMMIVYAICHMMGMSSACSNPVLYGWLNDNFWKEFKDILCFSKTNDAKIKEHKTTINPMQKEPDNNQKSFLGVPLDNHPGTTTNATEMSVLERTKMY